MRLALALTALLLVAPAASAQILQISFTDAKAAKKYKDHTVPSGEDQVLLGEAVQGGGIVIEDGQIKYMKATDPRQSDENRVFVFDPRKPGHVPYVVEDGVKVPAGKNAVAIVMGSHIERIQIYSRTDDIASLADEYQFRLARIEALEKERDDQARGSVEWIGAHHKLMVGYERLLTWLEEMGFFEAADKLEKTIGKERKRLKNEGTEARRRKALDSVQKVEPFPDLIESAKALAEGKYEFHVRQSQHVRFIYHTALDDEAMERLLEFAETVIDGFLVEFVDPYQGEDFANHVPDECFIEFFFGPDDDATHDGFYTSYYGQQWGANKERKFAIAFHQLIRALQPRLVFYLRWQDTMDFESTVANMLGKALARVHYGGGYGSQEQPWILEGLAYYLSFEYCGRNTVTSIEFKELAYTQPDTEEGEKTMQTGFRGLMNALALEGGPRLDKLTLLSIAEMADADFAKSWSLFDFVSKNLGKEGQRWLRAAWDHGKNRASFHKNWRTDSETLFAITGEDVFKLLDDRWRKFAGGDQDTGEDTRRR